MHAQHRRIVAPDAVDEPVDRDDAVRLEQQHPRARPAAARLRAARRGSPSRTSSGPRILNSTLPSGARVGTATAGGTSGRWRLLSRAEVERSVLLQYQPLELFQPRRRVDPEFVLEHPPEALEGLRAPRHVCRSGRGPASADLAAAPGADDGGRAHRAPRRVLRRRPSASSASMHSSRQMRCCSPSRVSSSRANGSSNSASGGPRHSSSASPQRGRCLLRGDRMRAPRVPWHGASQRYASRANGRRDRRAVPRRTCLDQPLRELLAEQRDEDLNHLRRARRHLLAPEVVDEPGHRDHAVCMKQQQCQQGLLLAARQVDGPCVVNRLERAENPKLHVPCRTIIGASRSADYAGGRSAGARAAAFRYGFAAKRPQLSGVPSSSCSPRPSNSMPEPTTMSLATAGARCFDRNRNFCGKGL